MFALREDIALAQNGILDMVRVQAWFSGIAHLRWP
jgi:hypothetical protein